MWMHELHDEMKQLHIYQFQLNSTAYKFQFSLVCLQIWSLFNLWWDYFGTGARIL